MARRGGTRRHGSAVSGKKHGSPGLGVQPRRSELEIPSRPRVSHQVRTGRGEAVLASVGIIGGRRGKAMADTIEISARLNPENTDHAWVRTAVLAVVSRSVA